MLSKIAPEIENSEISSLVFYSLLDLLRIPLGGEELYTVPYCCNYDIDFSMSVHGGLIFNIAFRGYRKTDSPLIQHLRCSGINQACMVGFKPEQDPKYESRIDWYIYGKKPILKTV